MLVSDFAPDKRLLSAPPLLFRSLTQDRPDAEGIKSPISYRSWNGGPNSSRPLTPKRPNSVYCHGAFNYARHNPHSRRVFHFKGLLDLPICHVEDNNPIQPNVTRPATSASQYAIPNINSQMRPINTLNGLALISALPPIKENAIPTRGLVPQKELWRDELRSLTEAVLLPLFINQQGKLPTKVEEGNKVPPHHPYPICRPVTAALIKESETKNHTNLENQQVNWALPSSTNMDSVAAVVFAPWKNEKVFPWENQIFLLLGQMLQAKSSDTVKTWLTKATDQEKIHALEQLNKVMSLEEIQNKEENVNRENITKNASIPISRPTTAASQVSLTHSMENKFDRLIVHDDAAAAAAAVAPKLPRVSEEIELLEIPTTPPIKSVNQNHSMILVEPEMKRRTIKCCPRCHADLNEETDSQRVGELVRKKKSYGNLRYVNANKNALLNPQLVRTTMNFSSMSFRQGRP